MQAQEYLEARAAQPKPKLKHLFSKGNFGPEFVESAKAELPFLWGRINMLEDFFALNEPGFSDRSRRLRDQLGTPRAYRQGLVWWLWRRIFGE